MKAQFRNKILTLLEYQVEHEM